MHFDYVVMKWVQRRNGDQRFRRICKILGQRTNPFLPFLTIFFLPQTTHSDFTRKNTPVGSRAFSVAGPQVWNCLPPEVTPAPSLATFRTRLHTFLFTELCPDIRLI